MKKFLKVLVGISAAAAVVIGILYFVKNILMKDYLDDYDDDDFDNDLYEEEEEEDDRYVTITPDASKADADKKAEDTADGDSSADAETEAAAEA